MVWFYDFVQQGKFASSVGADGHILTVLTNGMAPVSSVAEILESVRKKNQDRNIVFGIIMMLCNGWS